MVALYAPRFTNHHTGPTGRLGSDARRFGADARRRAEATKVTAQRHLHAVPELGVGDELRVGFDRIATLAVEARSARTGLWSASASAIRMMVVALMLATALIGIRFAQGSPSAVDPAPSNTGVNTAVSGELVGAEIVLSVAD